jgi:Concanavalin A-like lectin/glucanases superfamily
MKSDKCLRHERKTPVKTVNRLLGILAISAALAINGRSQTCAPMTSGLTDWWPGNGNANDIVGTNNGIIPDTVDVTFGGGEVGEAFVFSGISPDDNTTGNEVDFGTNVGNFGTNDFTIDFWIEMPSNAPNVYALLGKYPACNANINFWHLRIGPVEWTPPPSPGQLAFAIGNNGDVLCHLQSTNTINDGHFHHVALTRQGVVYTFYIDGILDNSITASGMANIDNNAVMKAGISACVGIENTLPFAGELDELGLWNRALSPEEIDAIYLAGSAGKCITLSSISLGLYPGVTITGTVGSNYIVQSTTNLSNTNSWVKVANLTLTQPVQLWVDTNVDASLPGNPQRFYQVLLGP